MSQRWSALGPGGPGCHQPGGAPILAGADDGGLLESSGRCRLGDLARLDVPGPAGLGRQEPDGAAVGERGDRVDQGVDQVAVTVTPPEQYHVDDLVGVLVDQLAAAVDQRVAEILVDVIVVPHLHNDHPRLDPEPVRQAPYAVGGLTSGRAHFLRASSTRSGARSTPMRVVHTVRAFRASGAPYNVAKEVTGRGPDARPGSPTLRRRGRARTRGRAGSASRP